MKTGLGRGLNSLFGDYEDDGVSSGNASVEVKTETVVVNEPKEIEIGLIDRNIEQPRKIFDEQALNELAESVKTYGIVQPIIVKEKDGRFIIVAGERRWRAARMAGLKTIPCIVKDYSKQEISEIAIIENLQREDLNPIESARAIKNLIDEFNLTQEDVADKIGKSRPAVANTLRLCLCQKPLLVWLKRIKFLLGTQEHCFLLKIQLNKRKLP